MSLNPRLRDWQGKTAWLIGASTGIGAAVANALHQRGARVIVSARRAERLKDFVREHPGATALPLDIASTAAIAEAQRQIVRSHGGIDFCLYCVGHYQPMQAEQFSLDESLRHLELNHVGALRLLDSLLPQLRLQAQQGRGGHLSLVASVAGFRGLPRSLAYGPSKAALTHLAEVLYLDLAALGLGVSVVQPGFVATPLTAQNDFHMPALISPEQAAAAMLAGWARGDFEIHFPKRFTAWLKLLRHLPYGLYFRVVRRITGA
ncbi:SDR family NAD(P)-dependent oxidoreductase [Paucibacter sp. APW11]|uniref:SDR family NAD(P)-dependent oxidoreductase n=1 Tax=Roseateles aquae TaxID=3077235 RepID=A0ABU3PAB3_9BURK|nr:SDR family NAD(P)-dependent oxidoreductase [Paucibacter sp. APW11]MDT8999463.1 SDR family NAD(P)-dependent oxidoreductase [Paucibacter sp. APW11]